MHQLMIYLQNIHCVNFLEGSRYQIGRIFGKVPRGGGSFSIQKFILHILDFYKGFFTDVFTKKFAIKFSENGVEGCLGCSENSSNLVV